MECRLRKNLLRWQRASSGAVILVMAVAFLIGGDADGKPVDKKTTLKSKRVLIERTERGQSTLVAVPRGAAYNVACKCVGKNSVTKRCKKVRAATSCVCSKGAVESSVQC